MGKFDNKEASRKAAGTARSTAKAMSGAKAAVNKRLVSFQTPTDAYQTFTYINAHLGITNTTALNLMIADYIKQHSDLLI